MARDETVERTSFQPQRVQTLEETGLPYGLLFDLLLKHAYFEGTATLTRLAERTKLNHAVVHSVYRDWQKEQLCSIRGMVGNDYEITLTTKGRDMAEVALKKGQYVGAAPVSLSDYNRAVVLQGIPVRVTVASLKVALQDLVLTDEVIHEIGAALVAGGAILLHGSTGNGKTSISERLHRVFQDRVYVPHAVEISGHIVAVFDPLIHRAEATARKDEDARWVLCQRPMVKVGGEMRAELLEPQVDEHTRICVAPIQMKANNGILLIDDFGRQRITPRELLNRWIVPLDRRTDVLSLWSGITFEIPFEVLVVFATNLALTDLAEDAFMRRLKNKIKINCLNDDVFKALLRRICGERNLPLAQNMEDYITQECSKRSADGLHGCYPADIASILCGRAVFEERAPSVEREDVDHALRAYFGD